MMAGLVIKMMSTGCFKLGRLDVIADLRRRLIWFLVTADLATLDETTMPKRENLADEGFEIDRK